MMDSQEIIIQRLEKLTEEHRELKDLIDEKLREPIVNQIALQRLKKRKLLLKDQIGKLRSQLLPDIIA
ncbi:MAG: DUF465 domain-containing protein [Holosporales bacterium]